MSLDAAAFRKALAQFASGVTVVTTRDAAGRALGLTVSAFCSVSLHPPLVLVSIDQRSDANTGMRESGHFAVSILAEDQEEISRRFARSGNDKLRGFTFAEGLQRLPLVPGALAQIQCRVRSFHQEGDHWLWVGEVLAVSVHAGRPLLYQRGEYRRLAAPGRAGKPGGDRV